MVLAILCVLYSRVGTGKVSMFSGCVNSMVHASAKRVFEPYNAMRFGMNDIQEPMLYT